MYAHLVTLCFLIAVFNQVCVGELVLTEKIAKTVTFDGEDLELHVKNPEGQTGVISVCVKSELSTTTADCQKGFASLRIPVTASHKEVTYRVNRQGNANNVDITVEGTFLFNADQSLDVMVASLPNGITLTMVNAAEVDVQDESETTTVIKDITVANQISNKAVIGIVCSVIAFILILLVIGLLIGLCVIRKRQSHQAVPTVNPEEGQPQPTGKGNQDQRQKKVARILSTASKQSSTTTTTKPSNETTKDKASAEPLIVAKTETVETEEMPVKQEKSVQNPKPPKPKTAPTSTAAAKSENKASEVIVTKESNPAPHETPKTLATVTQEAKSPLTLDKTQSLSPTTEPTPKFGTDATAKALAANSKLNSRRYLPRNEAPVPGSSVKRRPAPIADEVDEFRRATETYPCYAQRLKLLSGHDHMKLNERINVMVSHKPSDAERSLLKSSPEDAPKWADIVREEAHERMTKYSLHHDYREVSWEEKNEFWRYANDPATPASDGYLIMFYLLPAIFKPKKYAFSDPLIRGMPLCGLYTLLLDPTLTYNFRVALASEIRQKASKIIPCLQRDMFQNVAFPTCYLALAYSKNEASFVDGSEIHSKKTTMTQ
uniref:Uncharacterized protein n=1 Tax=Panagrellus redivivus TaxID=6233 RepID=A0A7E4WAB2_PANRE